MTDEILNKYGNFFDAIVLSFNYISRIEKPDEENYILELDIASMNINTRLYEHIKITFKNIISLNFVLGSSTAVGAFGIYINKTDDCITFDLEPIEYADYLAEDENSGFKIKCKHVEYTFIKLYE